MVGVGSEYTNIRYFFVKCKIFISNKGYIRYLYIIKVIKKSYEIKIYPIIKNNILSVSRTESDIKQKPVEALSLDKSMKQES